MANAISFPIGDSDTATIFVKNDGDIGWVGNFDLRLTDASIEANADNVAHQQSYALLISNLQVRVDLLSS